MPIAAYRLRGARVVFTGLMAIPRKDLIAMSEAAGVTVQKSVTLITDYLVLKDGVDPRGPITSSKHRKARQYGVTIITENDFMEKVS